MIEVIIPSKDAQACRKLIQDHAFELNIPTISKLVQQHAFDIRLSWSGRCEFEFLDHPFLWFDFTAHRITFCAYGDRAHFDGSPYQSISVNEFLAMESL